MCHIVSLVAETVVDTHVRQELTPCQARVAKTIFIVGVAKILITLIFNNKDKKDAGHFA